MSLLRHLITIRHFPLLAAFQRRCFWRPRASGVDTLIGTVQFAATAYALNHRALCFQRAVRAVISVCFGLICQARYLNGKRPALRAGRFEVLACRVCEEVCRVIWFVLRLVDVVSFAGLAATYSPAS